MALMWPREIPKWVLSDPRRDAEIAVYRTLESELDGTWSAYYSRPWWGLNDRGGEIDGEADFIIAHPQKGILILEVKGGVISYDPMSEKWRSTNRNNVTFKIKDPVQQAVRSKHQLLKKLQTSSKWPEGFVTMRHGVVFPDCDLNDRSTRYVASYETTIFCFASEFKRDFAGWIEARLADHSSEASQIRSRTSHGIHVMNALEEIVATPVKLRIPLTRLIEGDLQQMDSLLTGAQLFIISLLNSKNRIMVEGGAGTGKTVIACEFAKRRADMGDKVIYVCLSKPLAYKISKILGEFSSLTVLSIDGLGHLEFSRALNDGDYSTLIVDEAQDLDWDALEAIGRYCEINDANLKLFSDSNQSVYRKKEDLETRLNCESLLLSNNLRNTRLIAAVTERLYKGPLINSFPPEGEVPTFECVAELDITRVLVEKIVELRDEEGVSLSQMAVLTPDATIREALIAAFTRQRLQAKDSLRSTKDCITVETIRRFKGLESDIVFLILNYESANNMELAYVGASRARGRLYVYSSWAKSLVKEAILKVSTEQ